METLLEFLKAHYDYTLMGIVLFYMTGAILGWQWIVDATRHERRFGFGRFIYEHFKEVGYRRYQILLGFLLFCVGLFYWFFERSSFFK